MLTDQAIKAMKPPDKGYRILWDGKLKGFGCRISQAGTRAFVVLVASGRPKTIGRYPDTTLGMARASARELLARKTLREIHPARTAWDDAKQIYLAECEQKNRALTVRDYRRHIAVHFPFGRKALGDITTRDILRQLAPLPPSEKHHAFTAARAFLRWCVRQSLIDRSPCENMQTPPNGKSRERVLSPDEPKAIWKATEAPWCAFYAIVRLLILTGQRRGEIAALQWDWINEQERTITLPASVTKNKRTHCFPYGDLTARVLASVPRFEGCLYLFPAARQRSEKTTVFAGWGKPKAALDKECGVTDWTLHDARRSYSSAMASLGVPQIVVEKLLNHVSGGTLSPIASVYNRHAYMDEMREAILRYDAYLTTLISPKGLSP